MGLIAPLGVDVFNRFARLALHDGPAGSLECNIQRYREMRPGV
tara:strand:+ start:1298 stop:1426 length:129 start_codon:yes stop_codon:yes gene_type:complete